MGLFDKPKPGPTTHSVGKPPAPAKQKLTEKVRVAITQTIRQTAEVEMLRMDFDKLKHAAEHSPEGFSEEIGARLAKLPDADVEAEVEEAAAVIFDDETGTVVDEAGVDFTDDDEDDEGEEDS